MCYREEKQIDFIHEVQTAQVVIPFAHLETSGMELLRMSHWTQGQKSH